MEKDCSNLRKDLEKKGINKTSKIVVRATIVFTIMMIVVICLSETPFAAPLYQYIKVNKPLIEDSKDNKIKNLKDVGKQNDITKTDKQLKESSSSEKEKEITDKDEINIKNDTNMKDKENIYEKGVDLSNNPEYIAQLKEIYSEEDIKRLNEPRRWVIMPNVVGMSEKEALKTMNSLGIVVRVSYQDSRSGAEEGKCFAQDIAAGMKWNTDASVFIWIQRKDKKEEDLLIKKDIIKEDVVNKDIKPIEETPEHTQSPENTKAATQEPPQSSGFDDKNTSQASENKSN